MKNLSPINDNKDLTTKGYVDAKYTKPSEGIPKTDLASAVQTSLDKADTALQSYAETDPTVPDWAKASSKPKYTANEVEAVPISGGTMTGSLTIQEGNAINVSQYNDAGGVSLMNNGGGTATQFGSSSRPARMFSSEQPQWYKNGASQGVLAIKDDIKNGTLTIQQNGTNVATFGANQSTNATANITTITDVKMNGTSKVTNGVADLGTVLTDASKFATSAQGTKADNAMPKSGGTFTGEVKFGNTENFQGYYIKRMIGSLGAGTAYNNLDSLYKDGTYHRMWRLRFPSGSSFWGKIKITLYGGYSSFNASGVMSKSITCNFNTSSIYNNVGCYDGLGVNVEQDFRISEAIWNSTANAWEVLIWQENLSGNNSPVIMLECWTTNNTNYINAFNGITKQPVELTQSTSYSAQKASPTGGTKTVEWTTLPVYENPLGEEIATVAMLEDKTVTERTVLGWGFTKNTGTITGITMNGASKGTSGVVDLGTVITAHQDISGKANLSGGNTLSGNQVITGYLDIRGTAAEKHLKTRGIGGSDGNGNSSDLYLQYSSNYKTYFGNTAQSSLNADGSISITSGTTTGNLTVGGNLTINGTTTTVDSTTLQVKDKLIEVAHGNTAPLTTPAGLVAPKYDGSNSGGLVFDSTGTAYVGDITIEDGNINVEKSGLQPLATRTGLVDGNLVQYNSSEQTLNDAGKKIGDFALKTDIPTNYVTTDTEQTINGVKTFAAPSNVSGKEQATAWFNTANNGRVGFGKEAANSGTGIFFEQSKGTRRLNFRASQTAGAMVWEQPESGAQLYVDLGAKNSDYHRISFPSSGGTLALTSQIPTVNNGTLTIQKNGTNVQTFTANQSSSVTANITVPTTASDVGAAPKKAGVYLVKGNTTGTEGTWTGTSSDFTDYYDGLVVAYDIGVAGAATTTLNINGKGAKTVYLRGTTKLTTHYAVGTIILLVYSADADCWYKADYDANTNTQVRVYRQDASSYNKDYPLIASRTVAADLGKVGTEGSYEGVYGLISDTAANIPTTNPYTGESKFKTVTATTFNGNLSGNATTATTADNATKLGGQAASYYENKVTSVNSKTGAVSLEASDVDALSLDGGTINKSKTIKMDASANSDGANLKWGTVNSKNPYIGYASDQVDGTFVVGSLLGTNYASGLAIGGGSGNLLWKGTKVATTSDIPSVPTVNNGTLTIQKNGTSVGTFTANQSGDTTIALTDTTYSAGDGLSLSGTTFSWPLADRIKAATNADGTKSVYIGDLTESTDMGSYGFSAGKNTTVSGYYSAAIGYGNTTSNNYATAIGHTNTTSGDYGITLGGNRNTASGSYSATLGGWRNTASGYYSVAAGGQSKATGYYSVAMGCGNTANAYQAVLGRYATDSAGPTSSSDTTGDIFKIGKGTGTSALSNAFRVTTAGKAYGTSSFGSSGADYAEMWEWADGNPNNEDRRGKFVTVDENNKIRIATTNDEYLLGIISATPCVVGDVESENWKDMYLKDVFGQPIVKNVDVPEHTDEETGELVKAHTEEQWVLNPEYDPTRPYISRDERKEWAAVGLMGKLVVVDDGTCVAGRYCKLTGNGTATASTDKNDWRVLKRMDSTHVQILYR